MNTDNSTTESIFPVKLKPANRERIRIFAQNTNPFESNLSGTALQALYKLIQRKGDVIKVTTKEHELTGLKCLRFSKGCYIAIKHTPVKSGSFFPCIIKKYFLADTDL